MPERVQVWLDESGRPQYTVASRMNTAVEGMYVPESRLREAEADRDELDQGYKAWRAQYVTMKEENAALRAERDALQADLKALERAVLYYNDVRADSETGGCWVIPPCKPGEGKYNVCAHHWLIDAARAILDREGV